MDFPFVPGKQVEVPDLVFQDEVRLQAQETALLIMDMQNDFVKPEGQLRVPAAGETVPRIQRLLEAARQAGLRVVFVQDTHLEGDREEEIWPGHCHLGSWGWEIVDELKPRPHELICQKSRYDGFYGTWLEHYLSRVWQVENLVLVGTVANICVMHTAASAGLRWFHLVVPADGISALTEFDQAATLRQVSTLYSGEIVRSVEQIRVEVA